MPNTTGQLAKDKQTCPRCGGSGQIVVPDPDTGNMVSQTCPRCGGSGEI